jgi:hypothetical protein
LEASQQFSFLQGRLLAPRPTPIPEDQASVFISPRCRVTTHFSRLLRHAWVTVVLLDSGNWKYGVCIVICWRLIVIGWKC